MKAEEELVLLPEINFPESQTKRPSNKGAEKWLGQPIKCLDHGFVYLVDYMGNDLSVEQAARSVLPNEIEKVLIDSGNGRAYQHTTNMRSGEHAETDMKELYFRLFLCMAIVEPLMFADFEIKEYSDGTRGAQSIYKKP